MSTVRSHDNFYFAQEIRDRRKDELAMPPRFLLAQMRDSRITVGDRQVGMNDSVTLEITIESSSDEMELEFEIKWRKPSAAAASTPETPAMTEAGQGWHHS